MEAKIRYAILKTLSYFHVFEYPLTKKEIWKYLSVKCAIEQMEYALNDLAEAGIIFRIDDHYCLYNTPALVTKRKEGNRIGKIKLKNAMAIARFLGMFPFVEAVCISGSLSKDFAFQDSDLDYFIITAPNRLWTARNFMHLFRKLTFLVNRQQSFCMNYYISLQHPEISPKNMYTAIELSTLKTAWEHNGINELCEANKNWVSQYLPNAAYTGNTEKQQNRKLLLTRCFEWLINAFGGDMIEAAFYKTTMNRWTKKWRKKNYDVEKCMLSAGLHFNTPVNYPKNLPDIILEKHTDIYREVATRYLQMTNNMAPVSI